MFKKVIFMLSISLLAIVAIINFLEINNDMLQEKSDKRLKCNSEYYCDCMQLNLTKWNHERIDNLIYDMNKTFNDNLSFIHCEKIKTTEFEKSYYVSKDKSVLILTTDKEDNVVYFDWEVERSSIN